MRLRPEHSSIFATSLQRPAVGLDLDSLKLAEAWRGARERSLTGGISFVCGDVAQPPFRPGSFDCILLTEILEHLIQPAAGSGCLP